MALHINYSGTVNNRPSNAALCDRRVVLTNMYHIIIHCTRNKRRTTAYLAFGTEKIFPCVHVNYCINHVNGGGGNDVRNVIPRELKKKALFVYFRKSTVSPKFKSINLVGSFCFLIPAQFTNNCYCCLVNLEYFLVAR